MTPIQRNPDVHFENNEVIPDGHYLHEGKHIVHTARAVKVPFGRATKRTYVPGTSNSRIETVGLVIRDEDRARFEEALARKVPVKKPAAA